LWRLLRQADGREIDAAWSELAQQAAARLAEEGFTGKRAAIARSAALHYKGQSFDLLVAVPDRPFDAVMVAQLEEAFGREHEKTYGHRAGPEEPVELVSIQVVGHGLQEGAGVPQRVVLGRPEPPPGPPRAVYFGEPDGWIDTPILARSALTTRRAGPFIVEEYDATLLVPPGAAAETDHLGNVVIEL
jgi:N-methylhydantoinase A